MDISKKKLKEFLKDFYKKYQNGLEKGNYTGFAMTFAFLNSGYATYNWTTTDGKTHSFSMDMSGHVFAVTKITATTITFVNPWNSDMEYTVTWDEFLNMGIAQISTVLF